MTVNKEAKAEAEAKAEGISQDKHVTTKNDIIQDLCLSLPSVKILTKNYVFANQNQNIELFTLHCSSRKPIIYLYNGKEKHRNIGWYGTGSHCFYV